MIFEPMYPAFGVEYPKNIENLNSVEEHALYAFQLATSCCNQIEITPAGPYAGRIRTKDEYKLGAQILSAVVEPLLPHLVVQFVNEHGLDILLDRPNIGVYFARKYEEDLKILASAHFQDHTQEEIELAFEEYVSFVFTPISILRDLVNKRSSNIRDRVLTEELIIELANEISAEVFLAPISNCLGAPNHRRRSVLFWTCLFSTLLYSRNKLD